MSFVRIVGSKVNTRISWGFSSLIGENNEKSGKLLLHYEFM